MNAYLKITATSVFLVCFAAFTSPSTAQIHNWTNTSGGIFADNGNWDIGVPGPAGLARFNLNQSYNVEVTSDIQIGWVEQFNGTIKYLGGNLLKVANDVSFRAGEARIQDPGTEFQAIDDFLVGGTDNPLLQVENAAQVFVGDDLAIADGSSAWSGTVKVLNNGTRLDVGSSFTVGFYGTGSLHIESGAVVSSGAAADLGLVAGSHGSAVVTGNGSHLDISSANLHVGSSGEGVLDVLNGGRVSSTVGFVGGSNIGTATVDGLGSQWNSSNNLQIGTDADGTLVVRNGGTVSAPRVAIGRNSGGVGHAAVADEGSELNTDELFVGVGPTGNSPGVGTLHLQNGGDVFVGNNRPSTNTGSNLYVSDTTAAATMEVGNGSLINNDGGAYIGYNSNASGIVTVDDANWNNVDNIRVGFLGTGTMNIQNGSAVQIANSKSVLVATNIQATGALNVDGAGTTLVATNVWAGTRGVGTMNVTNGANVSNATGNGYIAGLGGTATANIDGLGSRWFNLNLFLGRTGGSDGGVGTLNVQNQATVYVGNNTPSIADALVVSDGGTNGILLAANGSEINSRDAYLGYGVNNAGDVELSGAGTVWNVAGDLTNGLLGSGSLAILDFASVNAQEIFVNDMSEIVMNDGQLDAGIRLDHKGTLHFTGGNNQVAGPVKNLPGAEIIVDPLATVAFQNRVEHLGNPFLVDGEVLFMDAYSGESAFTGVGDVRFGRAIQPFAADTGQIFFAGGVNVSMESSSQLVIDVTSTGNFDNMTVSGDLHLDGDITINWNNGFLPSAGQQYLIANVLGDTTGQFAGMVEGHLITQVGTVGVFISYEAGDGNDVALYTDVLPAVIVPAQVVVTRGDQATGDLFEIQYSDNQDLSIRRRSTDIQSRTEFEVASFATSANPSHMEVTLEGSVFARSTVVQEIKIYNFDTQQFEIVDSRDATRFSDSSATVVLTGNLARFVEDGTNVIVARVLYRSLNPRQQFSSNTDVFNWAMAD